MMRVDFDYLLEDFPGDAPNTNTIASIHVSQVCMAPVIQMWITEGIVQAGESSMSL